MATPIPGNHAEFSLAEVCQVCAAVPNAAASKLASETRFSGIGTDTRASLDGKLFVALRGEHFDAHDYLSEAFKRGARAALIERNVQAADRETDFPTLRVDSTLGGLSALAHAHRLRWAKPLIAVAGSAGKTTTRSLIAALLLRLHAGRVHFPLGNLNNRIGVPMVLFGLLPEHDLAVVEIGTNETGEVEALAKACAPNVGILTLIDLEHTAGLGDLDAIEEEEAALFRFTSDLAVGNGDDERVRRRVQLASAPRKLLYGYGNQNDYRVLEALLEDAPTGLQMRVRIRRAEGPELSFVTPFLGRPGVLASVAALATAEALGCVELGADELEAAFFDPGARQSGRLQPLVLTDGTVVIDDSYNANPISVLCGLEFAAELAQLKQGRLHAVLGEMRELGAMSKDEHRKVGAALPNYPLSSLVAVSGDARYFVSAQVANCCFVDDSEQALSVLRTQLRPGDVVLVKASRGVHAERVVHGLIGSTLA